MQFSMALPRALILGVVVALSGIAARDASAASPAVAVTNVNMRAGPGSYYPLVETLPSRAALTLYGCTANTSWCDVRWGASRGWVAANYIQIFYRGTATIVTPAIAPAIGLTVVVFNQAYWHNYYAGRPWYRQWNNYYRPLPYGPPGRVVAGCSDHGCGAAAVGPGHVGVGHCSGGICSGTAVRRGPYGQPYIRHGSFSWN